MLDDDHRGAVELRHQFEGGVGVVQVVVAELLALKLAGGGRARPRLQRAAGGDVESRLLMRVLAIAQLLPQRAGLTQVRRQKISFLTRHPVGDGGVVGRGVRVGGGRQPSAQPLGRTSVLRELGTYGGVIGGRGHDRHRAVVLRRRADERRPADIDVLDAGLPVAPRGQRLPERVEVDDHQVDGRDGVFRHLSPMGLEVATAQYAAKDARMQGLDPAVQNLREAGVRGHLRHRHPGLGDRLGRAPGRENLHPAPGKIASEIGKARLVGDGDQRTGHRLHGVGGHLGSVLRFAGAQKRFRPQRV